MSSGQEASARILAKQLVRVRGQITKMHGMKSQLSGVSARTTQMKASAAMTTAMSGASKAMAGMNEKISIADVGKTMQTLAQESAKMDMKQEMMDDVVDGSLGEEGEEDDADEVMNAVYDELGLDLVSQMGKTPQGTSSKQHEQVAAGKGSTKEEGDEDYADLQKRLAALRQ
eukprot:CAMPEP_0184675672 /NCGR_PEP_ID=MMETSP0308-20130426/87919_1 /TAXON_ID=38269 /ORGANISM="Gloeochaete witrockiana, Strain SAG 46.84" /LENGTH=171 /DNA_ID=CAMNT_0027123401 /DNA_START=287 /DNA_END=802 /DNA_ORIENTATION=+